MGGSVKKFEDLDVWKEGMQLAESLYLSLKDCRDYSLRDQIQRSAVSVPSNIAEGFERKSNKEFIQFLYIAKASCGELRTQLYLVAKIGLLDKLIIDNMLEKSRKISAILANLIKTRQENF